MSPRVVTRDGEVVPFDRKRIADAIFRASKDLGQPDRFMAEELADAVAGFLSRQLGPRPAELEEVHQLVERALTDTGQPALAEAYTRGRQRRAEARERLRVRRRSRRSGDPTDSELLVDPLTSDELVPWRKERIARALELEAGIPVSTAEEIATAIEEKVFASGMTRISTALVRALADNELFERGLLSAIPSQQLIGLPAYDLERMILARSRENATAASHNPESIGRSIAEMTLRRFALREIFSAEVATAHLEGRLHLHGLGQALRLGAVVHDLADLITHGLDFQGVPVVSAPPRHAATLAGQLQTYLRAMASWFAGPQGIAHLNLAYAPFTAGLSDDELFQLAQELVYATAQSGGSQGGKALAVDFNLVTRVPAHMKGRPLAGPGGVPTEESAEFYMPLALRFARALLKTWRAGDVRGAPFPFPRCVIGVGCLAELSAEELAIIELAADVGATNGSVVFCFDRNGTGGNMPLPAYRPSVRTGAAAFHGQTVTLSLPRIIGNALARGRNAELTQVLPGFERPAIGDLDLESLALEIKDVVDVALRACAQRRQYLMRLAASQELPLWEAGRSRAPASRERGASPRVDFSRLEFHVGVIGLAEALELALGQPVGESGVAEHTRLALLLLGGVRSRAIAQGETLGLLVRIVEAPCESASRRLARIDLRRFQEWQQALALDAEALGALPALPVFRGDAAAGEVYYTRGSCLPVDAPVAVQERLRREGRTQEYADAGALSEVHPGARGLTVPDVMQLLTTAQAATSVRALAFSPELVVCSDCATTSRWQPGREAVRCPHCYSYTARRVARIAGYYGAVADANPSKIQEINDRALFRI